MRSVSIAITATAALAAAPALADSFQPWAGCYIGANGGYALNPSITAYYHDSNFTPDPINGLKTPTISPPTAASVNGGVGGGEIGCNWQEEQFLVFGGEADIDLFTGTGGSASTVGPTSSSYQVGPGSNLPGSAVGTVSEQVSLRWLSTIRARVGLSILPDRGYDRGLLFLTGGLASGDVSSSGTVTVASPSAFATWDGSSSSILFGYTVGGGLEYALTGNWTTKAEYLYYRLGDASHPLNLVGSSGVASPYPTLGVTELSPVSGSILRIGLNYRFY